MGHYDLYGQSYPTAREAANAEMAQCAQIDSAISYREIEELKRSMPDGEEMHNIWQYIQILEGRISELEKKLLVD